MTDTITVTISNDPSTLGPEGTEEELEAYRARLEGELSVELDRDVEVELGSVIETSADEMEDYVRAWEAENWMGVLLRACDGL